MESDEPAYPPPIIHPSKHFVKYDFIATAAARRLLDGSLPTLPERTRVHTARSRAAGCGGRRSPRHTLSLCGGWASHVGDRGVPRVWLARIRRC
eukprot:15442116-Alexandrium_andersonii.AAC.1